MIKIGELVRYELNGIKVEEEISEIKNNRFVMKDSRIEVDIPTMRFFDNDRSIFVKFSDPTLSDSIYDISIESLITKLSSSIKASDEPAMASNKKEEFISLLKKCVLFMEDYDQYKEKYRGMFLGKVASARLLNPNPAQSKKQREFLKKIRGKRDNKIVTRISFDEDGSINSEKIDTPEFMKKYLK